MTDSKAHYESVSKAPSIRSSSPRTTIKLSAANRFWIGATIFALLTAAALIQSPRQDPFTSPRWIVSRGWWTHPLEWNAPSRLAKIECGLNAISALSDGTHIFAAGNRGMIVKSNDAGRSWIKKAITFSKPGNQPTPSTVSQSLLELDLVPSTYAAVSKADSRQSRPQERSIAVPAPTDDATLRGIYFVDDAQRGEVITEAGWRFFTNDGGDNWDTQFLESLYSLNAKPFQGPLRSVQVPKIAGEAGSNYVVIFSNNWFFRAADPPFYYPFDQGQTVYGSYESPSSTWVVGAAGVVWRSTDRGAYWTQLYTKTPNDLHGVFFLDDNKGWVVGSNGAVFSTNDAGINWQPKASGTKSQLNSIQFLSDGLHGWIAGNDGLILSTTDGGETWIHQTQGFEGTGGLYFRFPAPWYFLSLVGLGVALLSRRVDQVDLTPEESVADVLVSDRALEQADGDVLAFNSIARGISRFFRNENTLPPLTIAIIGEWGTGKSSLMNLLRVDLRSYKFRPVWFNAWHHQKEEYILASLLENIKLQAVPRWWTSRGIVFRAKLLWIRGWRQWFPLVALLFLIYVMLVYRLGNMGSDTTLAAFIKNVMASVTDPATVPSTANILTLIPLLAGIVTFVTAVWKGITAFGVKPASLLAGVSRGMSIRGLEAQTSFRQKFAVEFCDVTRALGERSMLIFIDDLDRCRPDQVVETLEAVNFLTTSGECFVVIGMARDYVESCVGRAFKDVAEEMIDEVDTTDVSEVAKKKRIEFARQYLDKLINIEVPVPAASQSQSLALLIASTKEKTEREKLTRFQIFKLSMLDIFSKHWRVVPALLTLAALLFLGYYIAHWLSVGPASDNSGKGTTAVAPPTQAPQQQVPAVSSNENPSAQVSSANERPNLIQGGRAQFSKNILPALALLGLIWLGASILTRRPGLVVKDSPRFVKALEIWHPIVFARQSTPRSTKRFMNHVRYLAMRQRRQSESQPPLQKVLSWLKEKFTGVSFKEVSELPEPGGQIIPDEILVALAAQETLEPETLDLLLMPAGVTTGDFGSGPRVQIRNMVAALKPLFDKAAQAHESEFKNLSKLDEYRDRFHQMTRNVQVR